LIIENQTGLHGFIQPREHAMSNQFGKSHQKKNGQQTDHGQQYPIPPGQLGLLVLPGLVCIG
jgi:hypothetical protein